METNPPEGRRTDQPGRRALRTPLLAAAFLICAVNAVNIGRQIQATSPRSPWEATEVMEAWRSLHGLPVYELGPEGHATHFYGALMPWLQGELFRWVGPNNRTGRVVTLIGALATITLIAASTRARREPLILFLVWAALLGLNHVTMQYFVENRPDMPALFLTAAAIAMLARGTDRARIAPIALGTACLIAGFFLKQTAAAFAAVPAVAIVLRGRRPTRAEVALALVPIAAMASILFFLKLAFPAVYHYMIVIPGSYRIEWHRLPGAGRLLALPCALALALAIDWLLAIRARRESGRDPRMIWVLATLAIAFPSSLAAYAKVGGVANSLLPALLAMIAFAALRLPASMARLERGLRSPGLLATAGIFSAILLLLSSFPYVRAPLINPLPGWEPRYNRAVEALAKVPGKVICPEDPTVPLFARSYAGRSLFAELDAHPDGGRLPEKLPGTVVAEINRADYVVDIRECWWDHLVERDLRGLGFVPADEMLPDLHPYRLWRRRETTQNPTPRTAWNSVDREPQRVAASR